MCRPFTSFRRVRQSVGREDSFSNLRGIQLCSKGGLLSDCQDSSYLLLCLGLLLLYSFHATSAPAVLTSPANDSSPSVALGAVSHASIAAAREETSQSPPEGSRSLMKSRKLGEAPVEERTDRETQEENGGWRMVKKRVPRFCLQVPTAEKYLCKKPKTIEEEYNCAKEVETNACRFEEIEVPTQCHKKKLVTKIVKCLKKQKVKKCWREPNVVPNKCKKQKPRQETYNCERTVAVSNCRQVVEPHHRQTCYRKSYFSAAYLCYRWQRKTVCSNGDRSSCTNIQVHSEPYPCVKTVYETKCDGTARKFFSSGHLPIGPPTAEGGGSGGRQAVAYCPMVPIQRAEICHRNVSNDVTDESCVKNLPEQCQIKNVAVPHTCQKSLPQLEEYQCTASRHHEVCEDKSVVEKNVCYRDMGADEEEVECPLVTWKKKCEEFEFDEISECEKAFYETETTQCQRKEMRKVCRVERKKEPRLCYRSKTVEKDYTCYRVQYRRVCMRPYS